MEISRQVFAEPADYLPGAVLTISKLRLTCGHKPAMEC